MIRTGIGYDIHRLVLGRRLVIGGVTIPSDRGLLGHSDGDVLLHALADAVLSAAALRDIGYHFPNTAAETEGMASTTILARSVQMVRDKGYEIANVAGTVIAEAPHLGQYIPTMCATIATTMGITTEQVAVLATTNEGLGAVGRGEGIAAFATALLVSKE